jgi:hypothetical protein
MDTLSHRFADCQKIFHTRLNNPMSDLINPQGLDDRIFTGERDADGFPVMRFPELADIPNAQQVFLDPRHADAVIRQQQAEAAPNERDAVATIKGIFTLARAEENDRVKRGWDVEYPAKTGISPDVVRAVIEKFRAQ